MRILKQCIFLLAIACLTDSAAASTVIASPSLQGTEGISFPFSTANGNSARFQQVYDASGFAQVSQGCIIRALGFNIRSGWGGGSVLPDIQFDLCTTPRGENGLSTTFSENVGGDDTVVYNRGPLTIWAGMPGAPGFNVVLPLTTPFTYRPGSGNLLLDIRYYSGGDGGQVPGPFDASDQAGDGVARIGAFGIGSTTGFADSAGLNTGFVVDAIPEPSSFALCFCGLIVFVMCRVGPVQRAFPNRSVDDRLFRHNHRDRWRGESAGT
jgi:hypothetical protein